MFEEMSSTQSAIGSHIAQADRGSSATVNVTYVRYENVTPRPVDPATIRAAQQQLAALPLDTIPNVCPLPTGSRMLFAHNPLFVGRTPDLQMLATIMNGSESNSSGHVQIAAITGLGGIGKTQLASEFVHRYGHYFAGGVFWLSFADADAVPAEIATCRTALDQELPPHIESLSLNEQVLLVLRAWQSAMPRLLVFDDCQKETLLARWRPPTGGCRILLTSRRAPWTSVLGVKTLRLGGLRPEESIALLLRYRPDLSGDDVDVIANKLGDLPLALHLAGGFLKKYRHIHSGTPAAYLEQLRQNPLLEHASFHGRGATFSVTSHDQNVERTFAVSYDCLNMADDTDREAIRELSRAASFAPGEPIPRNLLYATLQRAGDDVDKEFLFEDALERLTTFGLLESQEDGTLRLHRLLAEFVRRHIETTEKEEAQTAVEQVLLETANRLNKDGDPTQMLPLQPHLRAVTDKAKQRTDERAAKLCNILGSHLRMIGTYSEAQLFVRRALEINEQVLGPMHPDTALTLNNLADLFEAQGKYKQAEPLYLRALEIYEQVLGLMHLDTALTLNNLARFYRTQGKYKQAELRLKRALEIYEQVLDPTHPQMALVLNNLAGLYEAQGKYKQAEPLYLRALEIDEQVLGLMHPHTARVLNNLAVLYSDQGKYKQAELLYLRALEIYEQVLGTAHPDTARVLNNLARPYRTQDKYEQSEVRLKRALETYEQVLGPKHPDTARVLNNLGGLYEVQGKYEQAEPLYLRALAIYEQVLGLKHPHTARVLNNLAMLYSDQGKYEQAEPLYLRALAIRKRKLGPQHPDTAQSFNDLGKLYYTQGKYKQAEPLYRSALQIREAALETTHSDTVISLEGYANLLRILKRTEEAATLESRAKTLQSERHS